MTTTTQHTKNLLHLLGMLVGCTIFITSWIHYLWFHNHTTTTGHNTINNNIINDNHGIITTTTSSENNVPIHHQPPDPSLLRSSSSSLSSSSSWKPMNNETLTKTVRQSFPSSSPPPPPSSSSSSSSKNYFCYGSGANGLRLFTIHRSSSSNSSSKMNQSSTDDEGGSNRCTVTQRPYLETTISDEEGHCGIWSQYTAHWLERYACPPVVPSSSQTNNNDDSYYYHRDILVLQSDHGLYEAGNLSNLPTCILSVTVAGTKFPNSQLIVTPHELNPKLQLKVKNRIVFSKRNSNQMIWRGNELTDPTVLRQALVAMNDLDDDSNSWFNFQFAHRIGKYSNYRLKPQYLCDHYKYHIDIGGGSGTTWNALRWKLKCGSLVYRILPITTDVKGDNNDNNSIRKDWWHQYLIPMKHYIPIYINVTTTTTTNISALTQQLHEQLYIWYQWAENHPQKAEQIAYDGQQIAISTGTFDSFQQQMKIAFYNSCQPNLIEYEQYKTYCDKIKSNK